MFVDHGKIYIKAGKGGNGAVAFRREKYEPMGGPSGGDGGDGGSIYIAADERIRTLADYKYKKHYNAQNGEDGRNKNRYGSKGEDMTLLVPVGTVVKDENTGIVIADLNYDGQKCLIAKGGRGGRGNIKFKSSVRRAPGFAEPGTKGEAKNIILELKLIADVGLIGFPNVGKSTILSKTTGARPKIANYHFTTLSPNLGVVNLENGKGFVFADIPGLIEGAAAGIGLGHEFLRHIERTRLLLHVIDISGTEGRNPIDDYYKINEELKEYSQKLAEKKQIIVLNKIDLPGAAENIHLFRKELGEKHKIYEISAIKNTGMKKMLYDIFEMLEEIPEHRSFYDEQEVYKLHTFKKQDTIEVRKENQKFIVEGDFIERLVESTNFGDNESLKHFQKVLIDKGVITKLNELGASQDDTVNICGIEFDYIE